MKNSEWLTKLTKSQPLDCFEYPKSTPHLSVSWAMASLPWDQCFPWDTFRHTGHLFYQGTGRGSLKRKELFKPSKCGYPGQWNKKLNVVNRKHSPPHTCSVIVKQPVSLPVPTCLLHSPRWMPQPGSQGSGWLGWGPTSRHWHRQGQTGETKRNTWRYLGRFIFKTLSNISQQEFCLYMPRVKYEDVSQACIYIDLCKGVNS